MKNYNLALLGFGNVGQSLAVLLQQKEEELAADYKIGFRVTAIATGSHGAAINHDGIDLDRALEIARAGGNLNELSAVDEILDNLDFIRKSRADVLFENSPVNYQTGQPAIDHIRAALEAGMHAATANKGPVVHAHRELTDLAESRGRHFFFESTVMDGAPLFTLFRSAIPAAQLNKIEGVFNSTTNLILTRMENGESFEDAVRYAQDIGIAETDPSGDVDGWDSAIKTAALTTVLMGIPLKPADVEREGIRGISQEDITRAKSLGKRWKLVCSSTRIGDRVEAKVGPQMVGVESPMYGIDGTTSIAQFETDVLGKLSIVEENPGPHTTAYGLLADFINAVR